MKNQVLSIEQMQELKKLGIYTSKASMCWAPWRHTFQQDDKGMPILETIKTEYYLKVNDENDIWEENVPTFTLQDILEMLATRKQIHFNHSIGEVTLRVESQEDWAQVEWVDASYGNPIHTEYNEIPSLINAAFNMLKWCKRNNYI